MFWTLRWMLPPAAPTKGLFQKTSLNVTLQILWDYNMQTRNWFHQYNIWNKQTTCHPPFPVKWTVLLLACSSVAEVSYYSYLLIRFSYSTICRDNILLIDAFLSYVNFNLYVAVHSLVFSWACSLVMNVFLLKHIFFAKEMQNSLLVFSSQEARTYAEENGLLFMETSAKTAINVNDIFCEIGTILYICSC